jgi:hypothetical protein
MTTIGNRRSVVALAAALLSAPAMTQAPVPTALHLCNPKFRIL